MLELEKKYLNKLNLKYEVGNRHINMSCPICGEGNSPHKKRGYVYIDSDNTSFYMCYNGCSGMSYYQFLKYQDETLAKEYYKETIKTKFKERNTNKEVFKKKSKMKTKPFNKKEVIITLKGKDKVLKLSDINTSKQAKDFIKSRGFTVKELDKYGIYYNKELNALVFPFYTNKEMDEIYGVQVRLIDKKHFINITYDDSYKYYGEFIVNELSYGTDIFLFESIFDMMSSGISESIAMLGSDLTDEAIERFNNFNLIFCFDADEVGREKTIKYAEKGYDCLVHSSKNPLKDFNDMLQKGISKEKIKKYILSNIQSPKMSTLKSRLNKNYQLFEW